MEDGKTTTKWEETQFMEISALAYFSIKPHWIKTQVLLQNKPGALAGDFFKCSTVKFNVQYIAKVLYNFIVLGIKIY